jgi:hypothetical protein
MNRILSKKIQGFVMPLSLLFLLLISLLLSVQIQRQGYSTQRLRGLKVKAALISESNRFLEEFLNNGFSNSEKPEFEFQPSNAYSDKVVFKKATWGFYRQGRVRVQRGNYSNSLDFIFGKRVPDRDRIALVMEDNDHPLILSGDVRIVGKCFIPKRGYRRVSRFGKSIPSKDCLKDWEPSKSFRRDMIETYGSPFEKGLDCFESALESLSLSFPKGTESRFGAIYYFSQPIDLDSGDFEPHSIIVCPGIRILSTYRGSVQIFSERGIRVEKGARLVYPSGLALVGQGKCKLVIEEGTRVEGILFAVDADTEILIDAKAVILGEIYSQGAVDHRGKLFGSMQVRNPFYSVSSGKYQPYIIGGHIRPGELPEHFVFSFLYPQKGRSDVLAFL